MRHLVTAFLVVATAACATGGSRPESGAVSSQNAFLVGFERAVAGHRWGEVVDYFTPAYVAGQRDELLEGRSGQLLVEALGLAAVCPGYAGDEARSFACLDRVCAFRVRSEVEGEELPVRVRLEVEPRCGAEAVVGELTLVAGPSRGGKRLALEGPVG